MEETHWPPASTSAAQTGANEPWGRGNCGVSSSGVGYSKRARGIIPILKLPKLVGHDHPAGSPQTTGSTQKRCRNSGAYPINAFLSAGMSSSR